MRYEGKKLVCDALIYNWEEQQLSHFQESKLLKVLIQIYSTFHINLHDVKINLIFTNVCMYSANFYNLNLNILESPFTAGAVLLFSRSFSRLNLQMQLIYKDSFVSNNFFEFEMLEECCCGLLYPSYTTLCCWWSWEHANKGQLPWKEAGGSRVMGGGTVLYFCFFLNITSQPRPESGSWDRKPFGGIHYGCKLVLNHHSWRHLTSSCSYLSGF